MKTKIKFVPMCCGIKPFYLYATYTIDNNEKNASDLFSKHYTKIHKLYGKNH